MEEWLSAEDDEEWLSAEEDEESPLALLDEPCELDADPLSRGELDADPSSQGELDRVLEQASEGGPQAAPPTTPTARRSVVLVSPREVGVSRLLSLLRGQLAVVVCGLGHAGFVLSSRALAERALQSGETCFCAAKASSCSEVRPLSVLAGLSL